MTYRTAITGTCCLAIAALVIGLFAGGGSWTAAPAGIPDAGPLVGWALPILTLIATAAGTVTAGLLLSAGYVSNAQADLGKVRVSAGVWAAGAVAVWVLTIADVLGVSVIEALSPSVLTSAAFSIATANAWLLVAVIAIALAVMAPNARDANSVIASAVLAGVAIAVPALGGHAASLGDHVIAETSAVVHAVAASVWAGGLVVYAFHVFARDIRLRDAAQRFGTVAIVCVIALAISGVVNAYAHLGSVSQLITTGYGILVLLKAILLVALVCIAAPLRRKIVPALGSPATTGKLAVYVTAELLLIGAAFGIGGALSRSPAPRAETAAAGFPSECCSNIQLTGPSVI